MSTSSSYRIDLLSLPNNPSDPPVSFGCPSLLPALGVVGDQVYVADGNYGMSIFDRDPCGDPVTAVEMPGAGAVVILENWPNPFNPATVFDFYIPNDARVSLAIYSLDGRKVRDLVQEDLRTGTHQVRWAGKDDGGRQISSGVYFARIEAGRDSKTLKVVLLK